jgi:hypothetical protein
MIKATETIKLGAPISSFEMYGDGTIRLNGKVFKFQNDWNKNRHILGIMAMLDNRVRISDQLN